MLTQALKQAKPGGLALTVCTTGGGNSRNRLAARQDSNNLSIRNITQQIGKVAVGIASRYRFHFNP
ncbi:MAG: hypothetical protein ABI434_21550 [Burkholderiaceae bacterium]